MDIYIYIYVIYGSLPVSIPKPLIRYCVPRAGKQSYRTTLFRYVFHHTSGLANIHSPSCLHGSSRHIPPSSYPSSYVLRPGSRVVRHYDTFSPVTNLHPNPNICRVLSMSLLHFILRTVSIQFFVLHRPYLLAKHLSLQFSFDFLFFMCPTHL